MLNGKVAKTYITFKKKDVQKLTEVCATNRRSYASSGEQEQHRFYTEYVHLFY